MQKKLLSIGMLLLAMFGWSQTAMAGGLLMTEVLDPEYEPSYPVDCTSLVTNPNFDENLDGWTSTFGKGTDVKFSGDSYGSIKKYAEGWSGFWSGAGQPYKLTDGKFSQVISDLPEGEYTFSADVISKNQFLGEEGFPASMAELKGIHLFANAGCLNKTGDVVVDTEASDHNVSITFSNSVTRDVEIGIMAENTNCNWICFDNVKLFKVDEYHPTESDLIDMLDKNGYASVGHGTIILDETSSIFATWEEVALFKYCILTKDGDNFVFQQKNNSYRYTFVVEKGKVAQVVFKDPDDEKSYTFVPMVPESDLIALMDDNGYTDANGYKIVVNEDGKIEYDFFASPLSDFLSLTKDGDNYVYQNEGYRTTFVVDKGKVVRVEFRDSSEQTSTLMPIAPEIDLVALMNDNGYVSTGGFDISVNEEGRIVSTILSEALSDILALTRDGDNYVYQNFQYRFTFEVEDDKVVRVVFKDLGDEESYAFVPIVPERDLVALMNDNGYADAEGYKMTVNKDGKIETDYISAPLSEVLALIKDGENYVFWSDMCTYTFYVENNKVVKVQYEEPLDETQSSTYVPMVPESELIALMDGNGYASAEGRKVTVEDNVVTSDLVGAISETGIPLRKVGDNYVYGDRYIAFTFYVEKGKVVKVFFEDFNDGESFTYVPMVPESELIALMDENGYAGAEGRTVTVADGVVTSSFKGVISQLDVPLRKVGDNYVYGDKSFKFTFYVEKGKVVKVVYVDFQGDEITSHTYTPISLTTGLGNTPEAKSQKAFKTIENGQIIIIRDGERYDITGRKL